MKSDLVKRWVEENMGGGLQLRDYQLKAWGSLWSARMNKHRKRALIHLATGLGKTSVAAVDVAHYLKEENQVGRVLFVSHMNDISHQAEHTFNRMSPHLTTSFFKGELSDSAQVTFATFQSLYNALDTIDTKHFSYIIWDEAHHIEAETFSQVRKHFNTDFQLGLTATPERSDGRDILNYFGKAIFHKSLAEGIAEGWLSPVDYRIVFDQAIKDAMSKGFEAKSLKEIRDLFGIRARNEVISSEVMQRRHDIGLDQAKTIVFCQNIPAAEQMASLLKGEVYHSTLKPEDRASIFKRFKSGHLQVICTVDMFNEGIDIPDARLIVFLRSTSSRTIFEQQLGRGLRRHPGKDKVTVLDFVANVERINFVRELGRHTAAASGTKRGSYAVGGGQVSVETGMGYFDTSTFEFEEQAIQLLERYDAIKGGLNYLTSDQVVKKYKEMNGNASAVGRHFGVSSNAILKHLRRAGLDTSGHFRNDVTTEQIIEAYTRLRSTNLAAKELGISAATVLARLKKANHPIYDNHKRRFTDEEIVKAYEEGGRSLREASRRLGVTHQVIGKHLQRMGYDTTGPNTAKITEAQLEAAYDKTNGDIVKLVEELQFPWSKVYLALIRYGYVDDYPGKVTSARAAAAYYRYETLSRAGKALGVSGVYVSRLIKDAKYLRKYRTTRPGLTLTQIDQGRKYNDRAIPVSE